MSRDVVVEPPAMQGVSPFSGVPVYLRVFRAQLGPRIHLVFALALVAALIEAAGIVLLLPLVHALGVEGAASSGIGRWLVEALHRLGAQSLPAILGIIALAFAVKGLVSFASAAYSGHLRARLQRDLQARLYHAYCRMDYLYYVRKDTGHFLSVAGQIFPLLGAFHSLVILLVASLRTLVYFVLAFVVAWRFALMAVVVGVLVMLMFRRLNGYVRSLSMLEAREHAFLSMVLVQTIHGFKYLTATGRAEPLKKAAEGSIDRLKDYAWRMSVAAAFTSAVREPLLVGLIVLVVLVQISVLGQPLAPILVSILLFHRGVGAVLGLQSSWQHTLSMVGAVDLVREELAALDAHAQRRGGHSIGPFAVDVRFEQVGFAYDETVGEVIRNLSLRIPARSMVAFVGESGAGKSTLIDLLTCVLRPKRGRILIDGVDAATIDPESWRCQIGYVPQEPVIFDDSFANNICLWQGDPESDSALMERIREAARSAHIASFIESLPQGYATRVGDRGLRLSGGQRQRLCIARELFRQPALLILDEATSSLDGESELAIRESIEALRGTLTVVLIAHRLATIRNADRVFVIEAGTVREQGTYAELRDQDDSRFREMVRLQAL